TARAWPAATAECSSASLPSSARHRAARRSPRPRRRPTRPRPRSCATDAERAAPPPPLRRASSPSAVSAPPSSAPIATTPTTTNPTQTAIVRHGCRALVIATVCVESFIPLATVAPECAARIDPRARVALRPSEDRIVLGLDRQAGSCTELAEDATTHDLRLPRQSESPSRLQTDVAKGDDEYSRRVAGESRQ